MNSGDPRVVSTHPWTGSLLRMTHDELVALEHENWIAYLTGVVRCTGSAEVIRAGGVVTVLTGLPFDWFNQVLIEREEATPAGLLAAVARARERADHFVVRLREGIDDRFIPTLIQAGLAPTGEGTSTPGMVAFPIDHDPIAAQASTELEIRRITDAAGIDAHRQTVTAGFGSDPAVARGTVCPDFLNRPECVVYVGYAGDHPVVSGLAWRTGRTVGVYSIATIASARRRGYGAAMTAHVVADGVVAGCDVAALQASELGRPIYERLGFRTVVSYAAYTDPVPGA
jgi:GNAT superfamily N-acetyltransferase